MSAQGNGSSGDADRSTQDRVSADIDHVDSSENAFQKAIAIWRGIDLTSLQKQLDNEASEMITNQRDDLVERKEVAQKTKDYRKLNDADKLTEYKGLLKSYQQFIDHISNHRKSTESLFLNVYNRLSEAPDPYPLLEATVDSLVSSDDVSRLTTETNTLKTTNSRLNGQVQALESRVEELNRELSKKNGEGIKSLEKAEEGHKAVLEERTANWEAKEKSLQDKIEHQERVMKELKANYETNIRLGKVSGETKGSSGTTSMAELEILSSDLERTNARLAEMESRNEQLRSDLAQASAVASMPTGSTTDAEREELDNRISQLEKTNSNLFKKMETLKSDNEDRIREFEKKIKSAERDAEIARSERRSLNKKVTAWSDYEEIKRELEVLKTIEFSTGDDDDEEEDDEDDTEVEDGTSQGNGKGKKETLEQLLLARNKKLGSELTVLRVSHQDLTSRLAELQKNLDATTAELESSRSLTTKLEDDLQTVQSHAQLPSSAMSVAGTYTSRMGPAMSQAGSFRPRGAKESSTPSLFSGKSGNSSQANFDQIRAAAGGEQAPNQGILPMITAQRDRYKQRNTALEEDLQKNQDTISGLRQEVASLQKDNLQLYEKSRYISSYARGSAAGGSSFGNRSNNNNNNNNNNVGVHNNPSTSSGLSLDRYRAAYEANISPFEAFRSRETARAINRMGVIERVIHGLTRIIMRNRLTRNLFAGYCFVLHMLVFMVIYHSGISEIDRAMTGVGQQVKAGEVIMGAVGGADGSEWKPAEPPVG